MISGSNLHCIANNFKKILLFTSFMWTLMELICGESKVMVLKSAPDWNIVTKLCKIQLPKRLKKFIRKTNASPAALFTPLPILAPLARNAYCVRFPVPEEGFCIQIFLQKLFIVSHQGAGSLQR